MRVSKEPDPYRVETYEGLVIKTTQLFFKQVKLEKDDMRQELRITVHKAIRSYQGRRSRTVAGVKGYVFQCVTNRVKDMKRDAARRAAEGRMVVVHIEDQHKAGSPEDKDWFEYRYCQASQEETFDAAEGGRFVLPATITEDEQTILMLLVIGYAGTEIAQSLGLDYAFVVKCLRALRGKFADWRPSASEASHADAAVAA